MKFVYENLEDMDNDEEKKEDEVKKVVGEGDKNEVGEGEKVGKKKVKDGKVGKDVNEVKKDVGKKVVDGK
jgi:hypothetical protein